MVVPQQLDSRVGERVGFIQDQQPVAVPEYVDHALELSMVNADTLGPGMRANIKPLGQSLCQPFGMMIIPYDADVDRAHVLLVDRQGTAALADPRWADHKSNRPTFPRKSGNGKYVLGDLGTDELVAQGGGMRPGVENQVTDRVFRIGQTKNIQVHKFLCVGTLEEQIDEMIGRKKEVAEKVVGTGEGWLTELSTAELKELFALRKEVVAT